MALAQFGLGAITMVPVFEYLGHRGQDPRKLRMARALSKAYYLSFSIGATLGVFAVTVLIGVWGHEVGVVVNRFLPVVGVAFGIFPLMVPALVVYHNGFGRMRPMRHTLLGVYVWAMQTLFMVCIVGIDAYLTTPQHTGLLGATANALYWPLLVHRLVGNISWAALFVAAIAVIRLRRARTEADMAFHAWAAHVSLRIGAATLLLMPALGALMLWVLHDNAVGFFDNLVRGGTAWLFVVQSALLAGLFVGVNLALGLEVPHGGRGLDAESTAAVAVVAVGSLVGLLPSAVLGPSVYGVRYLGIAVAVLVTALHLTRRTLPRSARLRTAPTPGGMAVLPFATSAAGRRLVAGIGVTAMVLSLWMGFMKSEARGASGIYGELTLEQAHGPYAPSGTYP